MQELKKILEEIDIKIAGSMGKKREGLLEAHDIIRKHLSRENDSETMRLSRDTEGTNEEINLSKEEFDMLRFDDSVTFRCGNEYVSLYMGWDEATREYKNMNDGWIPVEEHPKKDYTAVFAVDKHDYYFVAVYDKEHGYRTNDVGADVDNIVAYCLFNPYRPERSEE